MKLVCDRLSLADALAMAGGVITTRTPTPALLCVRLVAKGGVLEISATDTEIGLSLTIPNVDITEEGEALIPADKLSQIVRACEHPWILHLSAVPRDESHSQARPHRRCSGGHDRVG